MDWPEASLSSNVFNLAAPLRPMNANVSGAVAGKINLVGEQENFSRATGGSENVEVARERLIAAGDVKGALSGVRKNNFRQADLEGVLAAGRFGHGQREIGPKISSRNASSAAVRRAGNRQALRPRPWLNWPLTRTCQSQAAQTSSSAGAAVL